MALLDQFGVARCNHLSDQLDLTGRRSCDPPYQVSAQLRTGGLGPVPRRSRLHRCHPNWRADSHRGFCCRSHPCQSDPMDPTDPTRPGPRPRPAPQSGRGGARPPRDGTTPAGRHAGPGRPRPDSQGRGSDHTLTRRGTAAGRAPDLDDSPPSGRPPPEHLRHTFATWLQHGGIPRPGHRRADEHAGDRPTARDGAARAA